MNDCVEDIGFVKSVSGNEERPLSVRDDEKSTHLLGHTNDSKQNTVTPDRSHHSLFLAVFGTGCNRTEIS